jgi:four helix bundle protein
LSFQKHLSYPVTKQPSAEGCSRKSPTERKRFYEVARGSAIEVDAAVDIAVALGYTSKQTLTELGSFLIRTFQLISKMIL